MKNIVLVLCLILALFVMQRCVKAPTFPIEPVLTMDSVSKTHLKQFADSLVIHFSFTDGDGDLGDPDKVNTFVTDVRPTAGYQLTDSIWRIPLIPRKGSLKQISGRITLTLPVGYTLCLPMKAMDTMYYKIKIVDRAGHESNSIQTPPLILDCN